MKCVKEKKLLALALIGIMGLSMMTSSIFAEENIGQQSIGNDSGNDIQLNYNRIEITDYIGTQNTPVTLDIGYAWDDMSWTYVTEVSKQSALTSSSYNEDEVFAIGYWYKGTYTETQFNTLDTDEKNAVQVPSVASNQSAISAENFTKTSKLIIHNYSNSSINLYLIIGDGTFGSKCADEAHGGFAVYDKVGKNVSYNATLTAFSSASGLEKTGTVTIAPFNTSLYGIVPMVSTSEVFEVYSANLTLNFTNAG